VPQYCPPFAAAQLVGLQLAGTHTFFPLHVCPDGQSPQGSALPQPSPIVPQNGLPPLPHVSGVQPAFTQLLLTQVCPPVHVPQSKR
jgi:hypothetical protein